MEDRKYIPVTWGDMGRFFLSLFSVGLVVLNFFLIIQSWKLLGLNETCSFGQLAIYWVLIGELLLISASAICWTAMVKKGFKNLKPIKEHGLIAWLIAGLIFGLIAGLFGLIVVPISIRLIVRLMVGPIAGLIVGLIVGLKNEFA